MLRDLAVTASNDWDRLALLLPLLATSNYDLQHLYANFTCIVVRATWNILRSLDHIRSCLMHTTNVCSDRTIVSVQDIGNAQHITAIRCLEQVQIGLRLMNRPIATHLYVPKHTSGYSLSCEFSRVTLRDLSTLGAIGTNVYWEKSSVYRATRALQSDHPAMGVCRQGWGCNFCKRLTLANLTEPEGLQ